MKVIPFGNIIEDRLELSRKYGLVRRIGEVWILTQKCRDNYNPISYIEYLRGQVEKPNKNTPSEKTAPSEKIEREQAIQELLAL